MASRGRPELSWTGSTQLGPDLATSVHEIRERHEHVKVVGSLNVVQTLLREKLFDCLDLWLHPIVLGVGKTSFDGTCQPTSRSSHPRSPAPRAPCTCAMGSPEALPRRGT
ncbi:dihydrofolate reductase family protein [Streptomyces sp. NPDC008141]|uniref:dihydrofolate reductase family protein n=1 Tax=Streptomyces sp. NPDC008141 TaxID=3364815 RepID=UPI0036E614BE